MTNEELRAQGPPEVVDNTMRSVVRDCWRKGYWFFRGADYATTPAYFIFGQAWQLMLVEWYNHQDEMKERRDPAFREEVLNSCLQVGTKHWEESGTIGVRNDTLDNLHLLFRHYVANFPHDPFKVIGSESGWEWPIKGTPYSLGGSLDQYIEWKPYGTLVMENKTTGTYLTDSYIEQWSFSNQVSQYIWYLTQLKGKEVFGCLMNLATKNIPKKKAPDNLFARNLERRSLFQLEKFIEEILLDIKDIEREWDRWVWPKASNPINCAGGIGRSPCLFRPLCKVDADPWNIDPTQFEGIVWREEKWEPWKRG